MKLAARYSGLAHQHQDRLQHVERFEAGDDHRLAILLRKMLVRAGTDHDAHVRRSDEAVDGHRAVVAHLGRFQDVRDCRRREHVAAQDAEIVKLARGGFANDQRGRRGRRFKADGEENDFAIGMFRRNLQAIGGRVQHAKVGAARLGPDQRQAAGSRHAQGVAVGADDRATRQREGDRMIDASDRQHAYRAAGAVDHAHVGRQQVLDAVARNGMRMTAAEFHEAVAAAGHDFGSQACGDLPRHFAVAEFIDVFHRFSVDGACACTEDCACSSCSNNSSVRLASSASILPMA